MITAKKNKEHPTDMTLMGKQLAVTNVTPT